MWNNWPKSTKSIALWLHLILITSLVAVPTSSGQQSFQIDNSHSSVIFSVSHFKIGYIYGRFNKCSGQVILDRFNPAASSFNLKIDAASVDTNHSERDTALRSAKFFNTDKYPTIEFVSSSVAEKDGVYSATGKLKIKDVTKDVTIPFTLLGAGDGPMGKARIGMISKFSVKRSEYDVKEMLENIGDDVAITLSFQAVRE